MFPQSKISRRTNITAKGKQNKRLHQVSLGPRVSMTSQNTAKFRGNHNFFPFLATTRTTSDSDITHTCSFLIECNPFCRELQRHGNR